MSAVSGIPFMGPNPSLHHQAVPVLHQHVPGMGQDAGLPIRLARMPGVGIGSACMRLIAALLPAPVPFLIAARHGIGAGARAAR